MRPQLRRRAAKQIKSATSAVEDSVTPVKTNRKRENVVASGLIDIRHNLSAVSIKTTVHDRKIAALTSRGASIASGAL
jgi:hypothetical protein